MPEQAPALVLRATAFTHQGAVRPRNEDTIAVGDWMMSQPMERPQVLERSVGRPTVCLVADGMGGHAAGDVASRLVAEHLSDRAGDIAGAQALGQLLRDADHRLFELMRERPALEGMGTTVAGLHVAPMALHVFNVGDSRVYRIAQDELVQLSTDDTPGPKQADGRTAVLNTPLLSQSLGGMRGPPAMVPHILAEPVAGRYLICSDGLTDLVSPDAMFAHIEADDAATVTALFEAAMAAGGSDNISIVLVRLCEA